MELWFTEHFLPLIGDSRPQVLVLDGHNRHNFVELLQVAQRNQIIIIGLPEHTSHWLQPMDRCVFGPFKKAYNYACQTLMNDHPGTVVSKTTFCGLLKKAWDSSMTETNLASGFRACDIYTADRNPIPSEAYQPSTVSVCKKPLFGTPAAEADETMDVSSKGSEDVQDFCSLLHHFGHLGFGGGKFWFDLIALCDPFHAGTRCVCQLYVHMYTSDTSIYTYSRIPVPRTG